MSYQLSTSESFDEACLGFCHFDQLCRQRLTQQDFENEFPNLAPTSLWYVYQNMQQKDMAMFIHLLYATTKDEYILWIVLRGLVRVTSISIGEDIGLWSHMYVHQRARTRGVSEVEKKDSQPSRVQPEGPHHQRDTRANQENCHDVMGPKHALSNVIQRVLDLPQNLQMYILQKPMSKMYPFGSITQLEHFRLKMTVTSAPAKTSDSQLQESDEFQVFVHPHFIPLILSKSFDTLDGTPVAMKWQQLSASDRARHLMAAVCSADGNLYKAITKPFVDSLCPG